MGRYEVSTDRDRLDVDLIHRFLAEDSYWARGVARDVVERSLENSLCFGVYADGAQVAFARAVTDRSTFAWLADVFVVEEHRGRGVGVLLMEAVLSHPDLQTLRRWLLATVDAHGLYRRFGFEDSPEARFMMREAEAARWVLDSPAALD
jgi:GNAT superfamily N-acetyltransferase